MSVVAYEPEPEPHDESDDEDARERNDYNIEEAVRGFVDEPFIRHDEVPEWESEVDTEEEWERAKRKQAKNDPKRGSGNLERGQFFFNGIAFKEVVLDYALRTSRNLKQNRYDKTKLEFICVGEGCSWRVYCSMTKSNEKWQIKLLSDAHSCVPNGHCEMVKVPVIARLFLDKLRDESDYFMPMKIEEIMLEKWKIVVTRPQCQAARNKALRWLEMEYKQQFERLRDYATEIELSNPGSTVVIDTNVNEEGLDVFDRFYVCFECLRRSWKETCRPLIGVDGCFLRGKMKDQLLVALGRDGNNGIYPIAWAVVQVENTDNWLWFVSKLKVDLALGNGDGFVMISDRQKGQIRAVELELPGIEHHMCVRHIYANLKAAHGKKPQMKPLIWCLAWSYNEADYNEALDRIFNYDVAVYNDVLKAKPKAWCRAFYKIGSHCEDVENNSTESFYNSIVNAREKPMVHMLETIARQAMVRIAKRDVKAHVHKGVCTPYVQAYLAVEHEKAGDCQVYRSTNMCFQVMLRGCPYRVNLEKRTCTCMKWDITGVPCEHAYGAIMKMKLEVEDFVSHWFRTATWIRTYTEGLTPMRGARFWPHGSSGAVHQPPEPPQPGRKKRNKKQKRKKGVNESPTKKQPQVMKKVMHCRQCGAAGHNIRFHKRPEASTAAQPSQVEPSQGVLSQAEMGFESV